ncbi:MAG: universal stress protein [Hyphomicrobiaceae bacterium]
MDVPAALSSSLEGRGQLSPGLSLLRWRSAMKKILMATDLSARFDRALLRAIAMVEEFKAELEIVHIVDESLIEAITLQHEAAARAAIEQQIGALPQGSTATITQRVVRGVDYLGIIQRSEEYGADLIVLGIHRHDAREMFQGTTAERVLRYGRLPVLVVKDAVKGPYRRAVVAVDLSAHAQAAAGMAARLVPKGEVHLVHAARRPFTAFLGHETQNQLIRDERARISAVLAESTRQLAAELGDAAPRFEIVLREGQVPRVIRDQIADLRPDLVAIGTHGRSGIAHAILGSAAEDLLADAPVDVMAVKARM